MGAEIESKFLINEETADDLEQLSKIGNFKVNNRRYVDICDTYYDTSDLVLARQRIGYRLRQVDGKYSIDLKIKKSVEDSKHTRDEYSDKISSEQVRKFTSNDFYLDVGASQEMEKILGKRRTELRQMVLIKHPRRVLDFFSGEQHIEMGIDEITYIINSHKQYYEYEVECEEKNMDDSCFSAYALLYWVRSGSEISIYSGNDGI